MFFYRRTIPGLAIHSYLVGNEQTGECAVIDPVRDVDEYLAVSRDNGLEIRSILETHVHADFVSGSKELKEALNGKANIYCSSLGGDPWVPLYADHHVKDGDEVKMGNLTLKAIYTPGHTPEHIMWALSENGKLLKLFTGDFLFVGSVGRPDLLGEEEVKRLARQLYHSVFERLDQFPDTVEIRPAHGAGSLCGKTLSSAPYSSLGIERVHNHYLKKVPEMEWIQDLMSEMPPIPKYFPRMKTINVQGPPSSGTVIKGMHSLSTADLREKMDKAGVIILDLRSKEAYASGHIPLSINIPISPKLSTWAGWVLPYPDPVVLILEESEHLDEAVRQLLRVGYDQIIGFLRGGIQAWEDAGLELKPLKTVSPVELSSCLEDTFVLDVRTQEEWDKGHIQGAFHLEGGLLPDQMSRIPRDRSVAVVCGSGYRSSIACSLLLKSGYTDVANVDGGMTGWTQEGYSSI